MSVRLLLVIVLALAATAESSVAAQQARPRIDGLEVTRDGERISVSFRVDDGLPDDAVERVRSGVTVRYRHRIDVSVRRSVPLWPAKTLARGRVDTSVTYDALTRSFRLTRTVDLRTTDEDRAEPPGTEERTTDSVAEVRRWMTEIADLQLEVPPRNAGSRLRLRVETVLGRRYALYLFPARHIVAAERKLEP